MKEKFEMPDVEVVEIDMSTCIICTSNTDIEEGSGND